MTLSLYDIFVYEVLRTKSGKINIHQVDFIKNFSENLE